MSSLMTCYAASTVPGMSSLMYNNPTVDIGDQSMVTKGPVGEAGIEDYLTRLSPAARSVPFYPSHTEWLYTEQDDQALLNGVPLSLLLDKPLTQVEIISPGEATQKGSTGNLHADDGSTKTISIFNERDPVLGRANDSSLSEGSTLPPPPPLRSVQESEGACGWMSEEGLPHSPPHPACGQEAHPRQSCTPRTSCKRGQGTPGHADDGGSDSQGPQSHGSFWTGVTTGILGLAGANVCSRRMKHSAQSSFDETVDWCSEAAGSAASKVVHSAVCGAKSAAYDLYSQIWSSCADLAVRAWEYTTYYPYQGTQLASRGFERVKTYLWDDSLCPTKLDADVGPKLDEIGLAVSREVKATLPQTETSDRTTSESEKPLAHKCERPA